MEITKKDLEHQYNRANKDWPFFKTIGKDLSPFLLFAVGSRETNLKNEVTDDGHGWGIFSRDDRSWDIPDDYIQDPRHQAQDAADLLLHNYQAISKIVKSTSQALKYACDAYNRGLGGTLRAIRAGEDPVKGTAHGNYSTDVMQRKLYLKNWLPKYQKNWNLGDHGGQVGVIQVRLEELQRLDSLSKLTRTGKFDHRTEQIIKEFQHSRHLDVDGIVGPITWRALF